MAKLAEQAERYDGTWKYSDGWISTWQDVVLTEMVQYTKEVAKVSLFFTCDTSGIDDFW